MIEKVVYLLGAGFSAPLGLPVMDNFLFKAKDMYFADPDRYRHFEKIFSEIRNISVTKNYYSADLFNIEEILSILEVRAQVGDSEQRNAFIRFLRDTVEFYTPSLLPYQEGRLPENWHAFVFGSLNTPYERLASFVANILGLSISMIHDAKGAPVELGARMRTDTMNRYAIITVNYDRVLEQIVDFIQKHYIAHKDYPVEFTHPPIADYSWASPALVKLHGSVDQDNIVPPTWSKGTMLGIADAWAAAHQLLREASQIRILGYSMPLADSYVKYLLKAAATESLHLKAIDVICRDPGGFVRKRYEEFITFRNLRFKSADLATYFFGEDQRIQLLTNTSDTLDFNGLEERHDQFMRTS